MSKLARIGGISTDFVFEGVVDLAPSTALTLRGSLGLSLLLPSEELTAAGEALGDVCLTEWDCEDNTGPYLGLQAALGTGLLYELGHVGLRLDLQVQAYSMRTFRVSTGGDDAKLTFQGLRPMMLAGVEL